MRSAVLNPEHCGQGYLLVNSKKKRNIVNMPDSSKSFSGSPMIALIATNVFSSRRAVSPQSCKTFLGNILCDSNKAQLRISITNLHERQGAERPINIGFIAINQISWFPGYQEVRELSQLKTIKFSAAGSGKRNKEVVTSSIKLLPAGSFAEDGTRSLESEVVIIMIKSLSTSAC